MGVEKIIAVMGVTGAGKSSFIKLVTGDESIKIGDNLTSETSEITSYKFRHRDRTIVLVDTPGFDDTQKKDTDILKVLTAWFEGTYRSGIKLCGIIYLHRITDDRMRGSSMRSLRMFRNLCGESFYRNLLLGTTCWSLIAEDLGAEKETELMKDSSFWKGFIAKGAQFARIPDDGFDAKELVYDLARLEPATLQIQHEIVDQQMNFDALSATQILDNGMAKIKAEQEAELQRAKLENQQGMEAQRREKQELIAQLEEEKCAHTMALRVLAEREAVKQSRAQFAEGLQKSTYLAKLYGLPTGFSTTCDGCCSWVGLNPYYVCQDLGCFDGTFTLCHTCYRSGTVFCKKKAHHGAMRMWTAVDDSPPNCKFSRSAVAATTHFSCYRCGNNMEGVFAHCCVCLNDGFNMCLDCLTKLGTCKKSWSLSGHRLWPVIRRVPKQPDPYTGAQVIFDRAKAFQDEKSYDEAIPLYLSLLEQREKGFRPEDELVRESNYNLGICYRATVNYAEAVPRLQKAYQGEKKAFGEDDGRTLYTAFDLGRTLVATGCSDDAETLLRAAIKRQDAFGDKDFCVRNSRYMLGDWHAGRREFAEAADMYRLSLRGAEEAEDETLSASFNLAKMCSFLEQFDESISMYNRTIAEARKSNGPNSKTELSAQWNLACVYEHMGEPLKASVDFSRVMEGYERTAGPNDEDTLAAMEKRADCLASAGYQSAAEPLYQTALQRRTEAFGAGHESTVKIAEKLSHL